MMNFLTLDSAAVGSALVLALAFWFIGGGYWAFMIVEMFIFLAVSALVTWVGTAYKKRKKLYQKSRTAENVVANGLAPLLFACLIYLGHLHSISFVEYAGIFGFIGSVAAITADKFSSELGVLDGVPRMIFTFRKCKKGESGGMTAVGLLSGLLGSAIIAATVVPFMLYFGVAAPNLYIGVAAVLAGGFIGTVVDSAFGFFENKGFGTKYTTNFACSIAGGIAVMLILLA
ncbi:MAG: DUF92 domain-containing protein [Candidatus Marsarchaeota archaeon]|jgi:uncharacterized protein (TIGR00297 family)|nr:DUF92 domain-containing protein [Candidatus Marsarchaeota archaeon]